MYREMVLEVSCNFAFDDNAPLLLHFWNSNSLPFPLSLLQIIRELREEVERLRLMTMGGGEGGGISAKELSELKEKLRISEDLMSEMSKSWEQKLLETQRIHQVWLVVLVCCDALYCSVPRYAVVNCGLLKREFARNIPKFSNPTLLPCLLLPSFLPSFPLSLSPSLPPSLPLSMPPFLPPSLPSPLSLPSPPPPPVGASESPGEHGDLGASLRDRSAGGQVLPCQPQCRSLHERAACLLPQGNRDVIQNAVTDSFFSSATDRVCFFVGIDTGWSC